MNYTIFSAQRMLKDIIKTCATFNYDTHINYSTYCKYENEINIVIDSLIEKLFFDYYSFTEFNDAIKNGNIQLNLAKKMDLYFRHSMNKNNSSIIKYYNEDASIENFVNHYEMLIKILKNSLHS